MRDFLHISGLFLAFAFLATRFPTDLPLAFGNEKATAPSFASFITLSSAAHAARLEAARTSWQVRSRARGRPAIGRLDADIPLLAETLPPPLNATFNPSSLPNASGLPPPDAETYAFLPPTAGGDEPGFAIPSRREGKAVPEGDRQDHPAFGRDEMLSIENSRTLKEIMK